MNTAAWWWAAGASPDNPDGPSPGPTPGFEIKNSLRFRGAQYLERTQTGSSSTYTVSVWFKASVPGPAPSTNSIQYLFFTSDTVPSYGSGIGLSYTSANYAKLVSYGDNYTYSNAVYRDPSAWYHLVASNNNGTLSVYINGQKIDGITPTIGNHGLSSKFFISKFATAASNFWEGHMADVYCIDGQALEPTAFGRELTTGQWVPREVDFTPATMRLSDFLTADGGFMADTATGGGATYAFNGNLEQRATTNNGNALVTFAPVPAIDFTDGVEVMVRSNSNVTLNGGAAIATNAGESGVWTELATGAGSINTITAQATNGSTTAVYGFRINPGTATEQILTNPFIYSADLTSASGWLNSSYLPSNAFDGSTSTEAVGATAGGQLIFAPRTSIEVSTGVWINSPNTPGGNFVWNGTTTPHSVAGWNFLPGTGEISASNPITFTPVNISNPNITAFAINDQANILVDGVNNSYGANGFHLDFSDPDDLGADRSGNGNDFTATGFNTEGPNGGPWNHNSKTFDQATMTVPTGGGDDPYWIDLVNNPNSPGGTSTEWNGNVPLGWCLGGVTDPINPNENATLFGDGSSVVPQVASLTFDLRDFPTINSVAVWTGWSAASGVTTTAEISLLDADKNLIPNTTVNPVRVGNSSQRQELSGTNVGARYIKFDQSSGGNASYYLYGIEVNGMILDASPASPDYDLMADSPTQNHATLNPIYPYPSVVTLSDANLKYFDSNQLMPHQC